MNYQKQHLESKIKILISEIILNDILNEELKNTSIIEVQLNGDNSNAKIYVDFLLVDKKHLNFNKERLLAHLSDLAPFIRKQLARQLETKKVPTLTFEIDELLENINRVEQVIEEVNN